MNLSFVRRSILAAVMALLACGSAARATNVCGPITANTNWNLAGLPYVLTCDVVVMPGATLTIDPGVLVQFSPGTTLKTQGGVINAIGNAGNFVVFASLNTSNFGNGVEVSPSGVTGGNFDYCAFIQLNAGIRIGCCGGTIPVIVNHSNFQQNTIGIAGYSGQQAQIKNCTFSINTTATDTADKLFEDCAFTNNGNNMQGVERITVRRCSIDGGTYGVGGAGNIYNVFVYDTTIKNTNVAVLTPTVMERCVIRNNQVGLRFVTPPNSVQCNDIYSNSVWNVESQTATTVTFANNWWGTTSTAAIDAGIKDGFDQAGLGFVLYTPVLPATFPTTGCNCVLPTVTLHPASQVKKGSQNVTFTITATGTPTLSYQWFRNNAAVSNGGRFSGATTATLSITPIAYNGGDFVWTDAGQYFCNVTNLCGTTSSNAATLTVNNCFADVNHSGTVTVQDVFDFLGLYFAGCP